MNRTIDTIAADELCLYACNFNGKLLNEVVATLLKFFKRGDYNHDRAVGYISRTLMTPAAKQYVIDCYSPGTVWKEIFPKPERDYAAETMAELLHSDFQLGAYE
jgi:hypothetical protein